MASIQIPEEITSFSSSPIVIKSKSQQVATWSGNPSAHLQGSGGTQMTDWVDDPKSLSNQIYTSYAGTDITAVLVIPGESGTFVLGELQTISYSIHRENTPVRTLGHVNPIGFVRGPRTIAGSLIFTQFNQYAFYKLSQYGKLMNKGIYPLADMLPPFDVVLSFVNESGSFSKMRIFGVTLIDEGTTMSVDDLITEQTYTFLARGIQPLTSYIPDGLKALQTRTLAGELKFGV